MKKKIITLLGIALIFFYSWSIRTPQYKGQLTLDLNNTTFTTIHGAMIEYEAINKVIKLPDIKPLERLIVIPPYDICGKPLKTRLFISYNGDTEQIVGEYYSSYGAKYNTDISQIGRAKFYNSKIIIPTFKSWVDLRRCFNFKPYFRIINMNTH